MKIRKKIKNFKKQQKKDTDKSMTPLEMGRIKKEVMREAGIVIKQKNPREAWELQKSSLRKSVNAMCFDCVGEEYHTSRIKFCNIFTCPLWVIRPYSKGITEKQCKEAVDKSV